MSGSGTCNQTASQTGFFTSYSDNALGQLASSSQNAQSASPQTRTYNYDLLGRMTEEVNPESGTTYYTYDTDSTCGTSNGDLVKKVDAVGNVICFAYDALHRLTAEWLSNGNSRASRVATTSRLMSWPPARWSWAHRAAGAF